MKSLEMRKYYKQIAEQEGLTVDEVQLIACSPFHLVNRVMRRADKKKLQFENIRVINFGIFGVKQGRKEHFRRKYERNSASRRPGSDTDKA